jgi:hypothetical protein
MEEFLRDKTPFERLLILGGAFWIGAKILDALITSHDTVNYALYRKKRLVYQGIAYEDRLDARLCEHELGGGGKNFDDCVYDYAKPCHKARQIERSAFNGIIPHIIFNIKLNSGG